MVQPGVERTPFGILPDGNMVERLTLRNRNAMEVAIISYGATLQSVRIADRNGAFADVTTGYATLSEYLQTPQYFGSTVGRFANRIAHGAFTLDGADYRLPINNGAHSLHGGQEGFDKRNWSITSVDVERLSVTFELTSPDGDQGYPGTMAVSATYQLCDDNKLTVEYRAECDAPTIVNLTNHAYWNLAGDGAPHSALDHLLTIYADQYLPVDTGLIPTGSREDVEGTPFDFRQPRRIGDAVRDATNGQIAAGRGYDHNWILDGGSTDHPRAIARLVDPRSGRRMTLFSNQPGLQFYSGNFLDGTTIGKSGQFYRMGDAIALEPQNFPDAPNQPNFLSCRLDPGETYRHLMAWQFDIDESLNA